MNLVSVDSYPLKFVIATHNNIPLRWQICDHMGNLRYSIQFPLLSKPKLSNLGGECISKVYTDELNSSVRYVGMYESNRIYTLKYESEVNAFSFAPLHTQGHIPMDWLWTVRAADRSIALTTRVSGELIAKVSRCATAGSDCIATAQFYRKMDLHLISAAIFTGSLLLHDTRMAREVKSPQKILKSATF